MVASTPETLSRCPKNSKLEDNTCSLIVFSSFVSFGAGGVEALENGILAAVSNTKKVKNAKHYKDTDK